MNTGIRPPAVAGLFYSGQAEALRTEIDELLHEGGEFDTAPKAVIVPHAGYIYSGPVAASAYAPLRRFARQYSRVVLLGPAHHVPLRGLATSGARAFRTPLGDIELDRFAIRAIEKLPQVTRLEQAHEKEHSLEVHLPFLQTVLDSFTLVPLVVGDAGTSAVAEVLDMLWGGPETLIVVSSDLSHYHEYGEARKRDERTCQAIEGLHPETIGYEDACGRNPVNGLLELARRHGLHATTLDLRNSGDTAGPRSQVVGYGAWEFH